MKLLKVGETFRYLEDDYIVLEVVTGTDNHVYYAFDYKRDGDLWYVFAGVLVGEELRPLSGSWV